MSRELTKYRGNEEDSILPYHNQVFHEFDSIIDRLHNAFWFDPSFSFKRNWKPVSYEEDDSNYIVEIELPRFRREEIKVTSENNYVHVVAKNEKSSFSNSFTLNNAQLDKIKVKLENGVLNITAPKTEKAKSKIIEIEEIK